MIDYKIPGKETKESPETIEKEQHLILDELENALRRSIKSNLENLAENWWSERIPPEFYEDLCLTGISNGRILRYIHSLDVLCRKYLKKDFDKANEQDIRKVVAEIEASNYSEASKFTLKIIIRRFYKWLRNTKDYPLKLHGYILRKIKLSASCPNRC